MWRIFFFFLCLCCSIVLLSGVCTPFFFVFSLILLVRFLRSLLPQVSLLRLLCSLDNWFSPFSLFSLQAYMCSNAGFLFRSFVFPLFSDT
jgi:hypothetical protein